MSKRENDGEINEKSKQRKPNDVDPNEIAAPVDDPSEERPPAIFKLNAICCDDLFEWLSLKDLHSLGQTCQRMQQLTGVYFQGNFKKELQFRYQNVFYNCSKLNGFIKFAQRIKLVSDDDGDFKYKLEKYDSLRHISFLCIELSAAIIDGIEEKLDKIETIDLASNGYPSEINLYDDFLKLCPNMKSLRVHRRHYLENEWMCHKYPKLEHLTLNSYPLAEECRSLGTFFQNHPHLQSFETIHQFLMGNSDTIIKSNIKLDVLYICEAIVIRDEFNDICTSLNRLYDNGFYQRLEYQFLSELSQYRLDQIGTLRGLKKLSGTFEKNVILPTIIGLNELNIHNSSIDNIDLEAMTVSFPNLRQVYLHEASTDQMLPFIRRLPKLKGLHINEFSTTNGFQIDLSALNVERKKLARACKVIIYLPENVYLDTKMAPRNLYANRDLIEIKRIESSKIKDKWSLHLC